MGRTKGSKNKVKQFNTSLSLAAAVNKLKSEPKLTKSGLPRKKRGENKKKKIKEQEEVKLPDLPVYRDERIVKYSSTDYSWSVRETFWREIPDELRVTSETDTGTTIISSENPEVKYNLVEYVSPGAKVRTGSYKLPRGGIVVTNPWGERAFIAQDKAMIWRKHLVIKNMNPKEETKTKIKKEKEIIDLPEENNSIEEFDINTAF
jgi:hypothetical protein